MNKYLTKVIETNQLKLKVDDISSTIAKILEDDLNKMGKDGWKLFSITPSLLVDGAVRKLILCFEKNG